MSTLATFIIVQEGRAFTPVTIRAEGLLVGRARECALRLNDPSLPMVLASIRENHGRFYFSPLIPSPFDKAKRSLISLNGREVRDEIALAGGDTLLIGDYRLALDENDGALVLKVTYPEDPAITSPGTDAETDQVTPKSSTRMVAGKVASRAGTEAEESDPLEQWINRRMWKSRQKVVRLNYLAPDLKRDAKTQYNWHPTRDLVPPWPLSLLFCCLLAAAATSVVVLLIAPSFFAPGKLSSAHTRTRLLLPQPIASAAVESCTSCHSLKGTIDQNCSLCHQATAFHAGTTKAHQAAGITCISCHAEHRGTDASSKALAFASCAACHNDNNHELYKGKSVRTAHGGTFGYPVSGGKWIWTGLDDEALKSRPEIAAMHLAGDSERQWRSKQFHEIHLFRVKSAPGIRGVQDGVLSCSSCHAFLGSKLDREMPRQTCGKCHNGYVDTLSGRVLVADDQPNCTSCHVQHSLDTYRWGDLLTESALEKRLRAIDETLINAVKKTASASPSPSP